MLPVGLSVKVFAVGIYLSTVLYVQLRGQVRHKLKRLPADHANVLAPYNTLMYLYYYYLFKWLLIGTLLCVIFV